MQRVLPLLILVVFSVYPARAIDVARYKFDKTHPPLLSKFGGAIYDIPDAQLQQVVGRAKWHTHTSVLVAGTTKHLNTDKDFLLTHRYFWILSSAPIRYATKTEYDIEEVKGYTKTSKAETEKNLGADAKAEIFGISLGAQASLKITNTDTEEWREEYTSKIHKTFDAQYIYDRWSLIEELASVVSTRTSIDAADINSTGPTVISKAAFRNVANVYEDSAADITAKILSNAVKDFGSSALKESIVSAPIQFQ